MVKNIPKHIAIIMDGNRRWAREKGLPVFAGHKQGVNTLKKVGDFCIKQGIKYLTVWAFSTENWERSKEEVNYLLGLMKEVVINELDEFHDRGAKINFFGGLEDFPVDLRKALGKATEKTKNNKKIFLNVAINYGGRTEIIRAVKKIINRGLSANQVTEEVFAKNLYTDNLSDPDLIIRTSGEQRTSGFLPWQSDYAELYFCKKYWPDFSEKDLQAALDEFQRRRRNFGK